MDNNVLPKGIVGFGAGQQWAVLYDQMPNQLSNSENNYETIPAMETESQFNGELSGLVGVGAGQDWAMLYPNANLNSNYDGEGEEDEEDGYKNKKLFKRAFCRKYVKSLGYLRREKIGGDKIAYIQAINECLVNYNDIKAKRYKQKPLDKEGELTDVDKLVADTEKEEASLQPPMKESISDTSSDTGVDTKDTKEKSKTIIYVILAIVVVVIAVVLYKKYKK